MPEFCAPAFFIPITFFKEDKPMPKTKTTAEHANSGQTA